jgi:tetratricopeptide (TPR) repeat protein
MKKIIIGAILVALSVLIPVSGANRTVKVSEAQAQFKNRGQLRKAERHFEKGMRHYRQGQHRLAMLEFKLAVKLYPGHWQAHYYLADSYRILGFYDLCLAHYDRVLVLYPRPIWVARVEFNIGTVYEKRGSYRLAGLHYDRALKARPGFGPAQKAKFRLVKYKRGKDWDDRDRDWNGRDRERRNRY